jgi:hypothetical protein
MIETCPTIKNSAKLPADATFFWRNGKWHMQSSRDSSLRVLSKSAAQILNELKFAGRLEEPTPGMFKLSGQVLRPMIDASESPLTRLAQMKLPSGETVLDADQLRAGERIRQDYERSHMAARVTASYEANGGAGNRQSQFSDNHIAKLADGALDARDKLHQALEAVGPELSGILLQVCCMAGGLEQAELRLKLPRRAGKAVLQLALTRLARHYGYKTPMRHAGPKQIGHWAVADFKPRIQPPPEHQP